MVRDVDADGNNVFAQAILSGSTEGLQGFAAVMDETLQEEEVFDIFLAYKYDETESAELTHGYLWLRMTARVERFSEFRQHEQLALRILCEAFILPVYEGVGPAYHARLAQKLFGPRSC